MDNNEQKKNNGQGIFYAVIGVATLVVTIIGATFAYFSASASSNANAITTNSASVSDILYLTEVNGLKNNLIPVDETLTRFKDVVGSGSTECQDDNGNNICGVYEFTIHNGNGTDKNATFAQRVYVTLSVNQNSFSFGTSQTNGTPTNLHYAVFKGSISQIQSQTNKFKVDSRTPVTTVTDSTANIIGANGDLVVGDSNLPLVITGSGRDVPQDITLAPLEQVIQPNQSVTYTVLVWLHETEHDQSVADNAAIPTVTSPTVDPSSGPSADSGKSFGATINVSTNSNGTGGITGVLAVTP